jgi:hypothetical protein
MLGKLLSLMVALVLLTAGAARADDAPAPPPPDKSGFTLFNPTPTDDLRSLCTDRPTKSTGPCTVDAGHWQVESDIYNWTQQSLGGVTTTTELFTNPTLKLGVTNTLDVEVNIAPYERITTRSGGVTTTAEGVGDLYLRAKWAPIGDDGGSFAFALVPYVKVPTASHSIGNGEVEGGVVAPIQFTLSNNLQVLFDPEIDVLADASGSGYHANTISLVSLTYPVSKTVNVSAELWGDANFDPSGTVSQASFDLGAAWIPAKQPDLQFDGGVNLGLNKATPGVQAYVGISHRF